MAWRPIAGLPPQIQASDGTLASGYYLKFYQDGTTTATNMATDATGGTTLAKCQINASGYPINGSSAVFIPHIDQDYKVALYTNDTDADADTLGNADWVVDSIEFESSLSDLQSTTTDDTTNGFHLVYYPPKTGETGVTNYEYPYGVDERYGCDPTGSTECATEVQNCINSAQALDIYCDMPGLYNVASTIYIYGATNGSSGGRFAGRIGKEPNSAGGRNQGLSWSGANNGTILIIEDVKSPKIDNISVCNNQATTTGVTGVKIAKPTNGAGATLQGGMVASIDVVGCKFGVMLGDQTNDTFTGNVQDCWIGNISGYNTAKLLTIDGQGQDNIHIGTVWSAGPASYSAETRDNIIDSIYCGTGLKIDKIMMRTDGITADNAAIHFQTSGDFDIGHINAEGGGTCRILEIDSISSRGPCCLRGLAVADGQNGDSSNVQILNKHRVGFTMLDCKFPSGNVETERPMTAINTTFLTGFGFVETGNNARVDHISTRYMTTDPAVDTDKETGALTLEEAKTQWFQLMDATGDVSNQSHLLTSVVREISDTSIADNTNTNIATIECADGGYVSVKVRYHIYRAHNLTRNFVESGEYMFVVITDSSGNMASATSSKTINAQALDGFSTLTITAGITEDAANDNFDIWFNQDNDLNDAASGIFYIEVMGSTAGTANPNARREDINITV